MPVGLNGADVLLYVNLGTDDDPNWAVVGSQRDVTFDESTDEIDVSSKDSRARRVLAGRYGATVSLDALYVPSDEAYLALQSAMRTGSQITIQRQESGAAVEYADAVVTGLSHGMPDQGEATVSIDLTIDGEWGSSWS